MKSVEIVCVINSLRLFRLCLLRVVESVRVFRLYVFSVCVISTGQL